MSPKSEDRHIKFEQALGFLRDNIKEVINHFHYNDTDTHQPLSQNINSTLIKSEISSNFFSEFLKLGSLIVNLAKKLLLHNDIVLDEKIGYYNKVSY